ncbi:hypothetical protein EVAR_3343_1 [Eumeta japonica]|uniref:Uncharacterized protein n=1 Tax=Eumeta variegata TaxID=151549 RepID=A0A4C1SUT7_EUMVA|nr:hypothetical protein EVAR_3343_1 [Eumeta japonica]
MEYPPLYRCYYGVAGYSRLQLAILTGLSYRGLELRTPQSEEKRLWEGIPHERGENFLNYLNEPKKRLKDTFSTS